MRRPSRDAQILPAGPLDAPVIAALQNDIFPNEPWSEQSVAVIVGATEGIAAIATGRAYGEVMPLGFVLARIAADEAELLSLGVLAEARGQGIGRRLLDAAAARARTAGARRLHLEVDAENDAALALYHSAGFAQSGRRAGYYQAGDGTTRDALLLYRELDIG